MDLGALTSRHLVRNRRRWVIATQGAAVGLVSTALLVVLVLHPVWSNAGGRLAGLLLVGVTVGFLVAAVQANAAVRGGPGESFEIHEHGIAHATKNGRRAWNWQQITGIRRLSNPGWFPRNGWDIRCTVSFDDGSKVQFNGLTVDADVVAAALLDHRPDALDTGEVIGGWRYGRWVLPFVAAGCVWVIVTVFRMFNADNLMVEESPGYYREVPRFDDSELALLALAALVCAVGLALSLAYLAVGLRAQFRRR